MLLFPFTDIISSHSLSWTLASETGGGELITASRSGSGNAARTSPKHFCSHQEVEVEVRFEAINSGRTIRTHMNNGDRDIDKLKVTGGRGSTLGLFAVDEVFLMNLFNRTMNLLKTRHNLVDLVKVQCDMIGKRSHRTY